MSLSLRMSKFANRSPFGTSQRTAYGISSGLSPSPGDAATAGGASLTWTSRLARCRRSGGVLDVDAGVGELLQFPADQPERAGADTDDIRLRHRRERDALPIDEGAVMAVQVDDAVCAGHVAQFGVVAGDIRVGDDDVVVERPADAQRLGGQWPDHARVARGRPAGRVQTGSPDGAAQEPGRLRDGQAGPRTPRRSRSGPSAGLRHRCRWYCRRPPAAN